MQQAEAQPGEHPLQPLVLRGGRRRLEFLGVLDQRADHEGLATRRHLGADQVVRLAFPRRCRRHHLGTHRDATPRHLVENGDVQVAVQGHRQGAGNRGGGHDEQVGFGAFGFGLELHPLMDSEAVLLVHHRHPEPSEPHPLLDQRMGSHDDVHRAVGDRRQHGVAVGR